MIELSKGQVTKVAHRLALVEGLIDAPIGTENDVVGILRINPDRMVVTVCTGCCLTECACLIVAPKELNTTLIQDTVVVRVADDTGEVERTDINC